MSHNPLRTHLIFYGAAISIVLGLFQITSAYGEANLKAPPNLNGRYLTTTPPPGCPPESRLALTLQQSGVYLNGSLSLEPDIASSPTQTVPASPATRIPQPLTLNGRWQQQAMQLTGSTTAFAACQIPSTPVTLQATKTDAGLAGQLQRDGQDPWPFVTTRQTTDTPTQTH